jgi:hypothetical protein
MAAGVVRQYLRHRFNLSKAIAAREDFAGRQNICIFGA